MQMLSELYGMIGQTLREHGDAPIADIQSILQPGIHTPHDFYVHKRVDVTFQQTEVSTGLVRPIKLNHYNISIV